MCLLLFLLLLLVFVYDVIGFVRLSVEDTTDCLELCGITDLSSSGSPEFLPVSDVARVAESLGWPCCWSLSGGR